MLRGGRGEERLVLPVLVEARLDLGLRGVRHRMVALVERHKIRAVEQRDLLQLDATAIVRRQDKQGGVDEARAFAEDAKRVALLADTDRFDEDQVELAA